MNKYLAVVEELFPTDELAPEHLASAIVNLVVQRGYIVQAEPLEDEARELREAGLVLQKPIIEAPAGQRLRLVAGEGEIIVMAWTKGIGGELGLEWCYWAAIDDTAKLVDQDNLRVEPDGRLGFYGQTLELDERTQEFCVYNQARDLKALYRYPIDDVSRVFEPETNKSA